MDSNRNHTYMHCTIVLYYLKAHAVVIRVALVNLGSIQHSEPPKYNTYNIVFQKYPIFESAFTCWN